MNQIFGVKRFSAVCLTVLVSASTFSLSADPKPNNTVPTPKPSGLSKIEDAACKYDRFLSPAVGIILQMAHQEYNQRRMFDSVYPKPLDDAQKRRFQDSLKKYLSEKEIAKLLPYVYTSSGAVRDNAFSLGSKIVLDEKLFTKLTDPQLAFIVLHESGHRAHGDASVWRFGGILGKKCISRSLLVAGWYGAHYGLQKVFNKTYFAMVKKQNVLRTVPHSYINFMLTLATMYAYNFASGYKKEHDADQYAFSRLKADAYTGATALTVMHNRGVKHYKPTGIFAQDLSQKPTIKQWLAYTIKCRLFSQHPYDYYRLEHAKRIAKKHGWSESNDKSKKDSAQ
ncbi:MAG: hypothetical protein UU47_C0007G0025 [candidate division TM6 bacterium GW2011_GWE2_41_16]|nr:MAG: hypothetical protein UU47_C0007G0025 [candidate division TM6 bacterium GW2011_GWE2_41_16]